MTDALDEGAATAHDGKSGEHPKDRCDEGAGHFMHSGVVGEEHEELLAESDIQTHEKQSQDDRKAPCPVNGLLGTVFLSRRNVLADHGHGGILNALGDFVDDVVDAYTHAKRRGGNHPHLVDEGIDEQHGDVDKARLHSHGCAEACNHADVVAVGDKALFFKVKTECLALFVKIKQGEEEGDGLSDDGRIGSADDTPAEKSREQKIQHKVDDRCNADEEEGTFGISHAAQDCRDHVVARSKDQTGGTDGQVLHGHIVGFGRDLHDREDRGAEQEQDGRQNKGKCRDKGKQRADHVVLLLALFRAQRLRDEHLAAVGKSQTHHGGEVDDLTCL